MTKDRLGIQPQTRASG